MNDFWRQLCAFLRCQLLVNNQLYLIWLVCKFKGLDVYYQNLWVLLNSCGIYWLWMLFNSSVYVFCSMASPGPGQHVHWCCMFTDWISNHYQQHRRKNSGNDSYSSPYVCLCTGHCWWVLLQYIGKILEDCDGRLYQFMCECFNAVAKTELLCMVWRHWVWVPHSLKFIIVIICACTGIASHYVLWLKYISSKFFTAW